MEDALRFLALSVGASVIALTVRGAHKEMGAVFSIAAGAVIALLLLDKLREVVSLLSDMAKHAQMENAHVAVILKVLGISFLTEFSAQVCRDAGEGGIALRVELGGKLMLVLVSLPMLQKMIQIILELTE